MSVSDCMLKLKAESSFWATWYTVMIQSYHPKAYSMAFFHQTPSFFSASPAWKVEKRYMYTHQATKWPNKKCKDLSVHIRLCQKIQYTKRNWGSTIWTMPAVLKSSAFRWTFESLASATPSRLHRFIHVVIHKLKSKSKFCLRTHIFLAECESCNRILVQSFRWKLAHKENSQGKINSAYLIWRSSLIRLCQWPKWSACFASPTRWSVYRAKCFSRYCVVHTVQCYTVIWTAFIIQVRFTTHHSFVYTLSHSNHYVVADHFAVFTQRFFCSDEGFVVKMHPVSIVGRLNSNIKKCLLTLVFDPSQMMVYLTNT